MNRRDFHKTLIAGAGMAAVPVWANILPTPEDMLCGHQLRPGVRCERERGHDWEHRKHKPWTMDAFPGRVDAISVIEWNDDLVVWRRPDRGYIIKPDPHSGEDALWGFERMLIHDARLRLAPGTIFELRTPPTSDPLIDWGMAWYWQPAPHEIPRGFNPAHRTMIQTGFFRVPPLEGFPRNGYNVFARLRA